VIGPFDRPGITPDDVPGFVHDEPEDDERSVICSECLTHTLEDFVTGGRCEECAAPVEEAAQASLLERLKRAHVAAVNRKDVLSARKLEMWVSQVTAIENGLSEIVDVGF
jgi:hypothetical protein